ncbi:MAG: preprotein translocase subunit SecY [Candidatus Paracaedibacteraceae bacterium]|nr:preprotein translocase subunit SecY [Candidatus Paracaedibacteraceae bacterium]
MSSAIEQLASGISLASFSKAEDLKKRIMFTLCALVIFRLGTYITIPGINPLIIAEFTKSHSGGILGILDMFSGGAIGRMTVFSLNIMPYISASIIVQLMTTISPHLESLKKEGESGRKKLNQYTRYGTVFLAVIQAYGIAIGLEKMSGYSGSAVIDAGFFFRLSTVVTLTGGTMFVVWLGEQITSRGIGNGTSLIIFSGIVANLPQALIQTLQLGQQGSLSTFIILGVFLMVISVIGYIVFMEKAQRRIPIQYPKRQMSANMPASSQSTHLPLKINSAGVIPPIFASSILLMPTTIIGFAGGGDPSSVWGKIASVMAHGQPLYMLSFVIMIIFFAFFYTAIMFNPAETAENLRKSGSYIPGIRPGAQTAQYIDFVMTRLTVVGALYLASICILPEIILSQVALPFYFGGTSILIVVSTTIDTIGQVQSHLVAHQYEGLIKKARSRGALV